MVQPFDTLPFVANGFIYCLCLWREFLRDVVRRSWTYLYTTYDTFCKSAAAWRRCENL